MGHLRSVVIFCRDPYVLAPFWSEVLGMPPVDDDAAALAEHSLAPGESVLLRSAGNPDVWITPVEWLDPPGNRLHLDVDVQPGDVEQLLTVGAQYVRDEAEWTVLADPEGNHFCAVPRAG
jgi:hypothetical protein